MRFLRSHRSNFSLCWTHVSFSCGSGDREDYCFHSENARKRSFRCSSSSTFRLCAPHSYETCSLRGNRPCLPLMDTGVFSFRRVTSLLQRPPALALSLLPAALLFSSCEGLNGHRNTIACSYSTHDPNPDMAELQPRGNCAYKRNGRIFVCGSTLKKLEFTETGLASIFSKPYGWLFVKRDGSTLRTITFDNGPDHFVEGLARYTDGAKIGFIDESGNIAVKARFQHAFPFNKGYSRVCNGCEEISDGEHAGLKGGLWGCIDRKGRIVFLPRYSEVEINRKLEEVYRNQTNPAGS